MERWQTVTTLEEIVALSKRGHVVISKQGVTGYPAGEEKVRIGHLSPLDADSTEWAQIARLLEGQNQVYADVL